MVSMNAYWGKIPHFSFESYRLGRLDQAFGETRKWFSRSSKILCLISCLIIRSIQLVILGYPLCLDTHVVKHAAWVCSFWGCLRFRPTAIMGYDPVVGWFEVTIDTHKWHWHLDVDGCSWISFSDQFEEWLTWGPSYPLVICNIAIEHCYL